MGRSTKDRQDVFYRLAKEEGWRARSAYKLLQIDEQVDLFSGVTRVVDLCAAPGSWSQVLSKSLSRVHRDNGKQLPPTEGGKQSGLENGVKIVAVDIQTVAPIEGVTIIQGDITRPETAAKIVDEFRGGKAQLVICDGAPDVTGQHDLDQFLQAQLLLAALNITTFIIQDGGTFVAKVFRGQDISLMMTQFRLFFDQVHVIKPKSSRAASIESFICGRKFRIPHLYKPRMFSSLVEITGEDPNQLDCNSCKIIPFLFCGDLDKLNKQAYQNEDELL